MQTGCGSKMLVIMSLVAIFLFSVYHIFLITEEQFQSQTISTGSEHAGTRVRLLFVESKFTLTSQQKIETIHDAFGNDLVVIWDNKKMPQCPFTGVRCVSNQSVTRSQGWAPAWSVGLGLEKAMMWAIEHAAEFDYVWTMDSDVHFTSIDILKRVVYVKSKSDLLTQEVGIDCGVSGHRWYWREEFWKSWKNSGLPPLCFHSMLNLYRLSHPLMARLEEVRSLNGGDWMFYEGIIPTTTRHFNLTEEPWWELVDLPQTQWTMRFRPCFVNLTVPGIYHPVKFKDDRPVECSMELSSAEKR